MSIVRAFTTRRNKPDDLVNIHLGRAATQRQGKPAVHRSQISSPVALVSTTNPLSYDAPSIKGTSPIGHRNVSSTSSANSSHSAEDSDASTLSISAVTDASSVDASPITPEPEPNHLSCYFKPAVDTALHSSTSSLSSRPTSTDAPAIPKRVPSHSKKAHEQLHRKRSVQRMMSPPASIIASRRESADMFSHSVDAPKEGPFGNELAQLDEVQEELSHAVRDAEREAEVADLKAHGYACLPASEYLAAIHHLLYDVYLAEETSWI